MARMCISFHAKYELRRGHELRLLITLHKMLIKYLNTPLAAAPILLGLLLGLVFLALVYSLMYLLMYSLTDSLMYSLT